LTVYSGSEVQGERGAKLLAGGLKREVQAMRQPYFLIANVVNALKVVEIQDQERVGKRLQAVRGQRTVIGNIKLRSGMTALLDIKSRRTG
jgi:hypothetical protein